MDTWGDKEHALYRYLTMWCDFSPKRAREAINSPPEMRRAVGFPYWGQDSSESIESPMEQNPNRRAR